jgi:hypothetical protein
MLTVLALGSLLQGCHLYCHHVPRNARGALQAAAAIRQLYGQPAHRATDKSIERNRSTKEFAIEIHSNTARELR